MPAEAVTSLREPSSQLRMRAMMAFIHRRMHERMRKIAGERGETDGFSSTTRSSYLHS